MLGSSTKRFKTYGKHKGNVVNVRVALGESSSTNNNRKPVKSGGWSDSDSESEVEIIKKKSVAVPIEKRKPLAKNRNRSESSQNKENVSSSSSRSASSAKTNSTTSIRGGGGAKKKPVVLVLDSTEESSGSAQPRVPLRKKKVFPGTLRTQVKHSRVVESEEESDVVVVVEKEAEPVEEILILEHDAEEPTNEGEEEEEELTQQEGETPVPESRTPSFSSLPFPSILSPLLASTLSPDAFKPYDFSSFVESPLAPFSTPSTEDEPWRKVGEASYSEVFSTTSIEGKEIVVKIIPIASIKKGNDEKTGEEELPFSSDWEAVKREIEISKCLGGEGEDRRVEGFVRFRGAFLVQGSYPSSLLSAWDRFKSQQKPACDDQIRPHVLPSSQLYALILLDHAGTDLESWKLRNWREAREIWDQVVEQLGNAERELEFEHRDLHWGNILIAPAPPPSALDLPERFDSLHLTPKKTTPRTSLPLGPTVKATLIDFTLSRMLKPSTPSVSFTRSRSKSKTSVKPTVLFDSFEDECVFEGEGDIQFDVYRGMRTIVEREGGGWEGFHPRTNLLWLHYLATKLLDSKKLKTPSLPPSASSTSTAAFCSPSRAVPSPRKTRRHSLLFSNNSIAPSSPIAERKSRTLPSSSLLSRQRVLSEKQREEMVEEVKAWESLKNAQAVLKVILGDLVEDGNGSTKSEVRKPTKSRSKVVKQKVEEEEQGEFEGAAQFATWWKQC
ncbi:uncharacterized protein JCM6883_006994 [Sporobolomyces salmoneus]|uniref:uncharacterized protein n=1 Tax=Sporobolomyces salmoneus TaxID=183962 RepID=UPI00316D3982